MDEKRILLIGKTGNGKSSTGNTILGKTVFNVTRGIVSETMKATVGEDKTKKLKVVDTPDICMEEMEIKDRSKELEDWLLLTSPGPTAILLVIRGDVRFTPEEDTICQTTMKLLGDHYYDSLVVVFTMKDNVKTNIEEDLKSANERLKCLLEKVQGRLVVISNTADEKEKQKCVKQIMKTVDSITNTNWKNKSLRVMLLGMTGRGKSSTGNHIMSTDCFKTASGIIPVTNSCQKTSGYICGRFVSILDTPGLDTMQEMTLIDSVKEWFKFKSFQAGQHTGPNILLYVLRGHDRFTDLEYELFRKLKDIIGPDVFSYVILVFTGGDQLKESTPNASSDKSHALSCFLDNVKVKGGNYSALSHFLDEVKVRYVIFNNNTSDDRENHHQRKTLLSMMAHLVEYNKSQNKEECTIQKRPQHCTVL